MTGLGAAEYIKLAIFYGSYLYLPAAPLLAYITIKSRGGRAIAAMLVLIGLTILAYARFVEPRILLTREHSVSLTRCFEQKGSLRLAVFSDTHNGLFANAMPIDRIGARIVKIKPDAVLIAGDFIYFMHPDNMRKAFEGLQWVDAPVIGVLGNHDVGVPGPDLTDPLNRSLKGVGVHMIDNQTLFINKGDRRIELSGISDLWQDRQRFSHLTEDAPHPRIVLTHNPATVKHIPASAPVDLLVAGHTHGGQINIPFVTCKVVAFACRIVRQGFSDHPRAIVFVTTGTGMVGLPMRFNAPPQIDVLNIRYNACPTS